MHVIISAQSGYGNLQFGSRVAPWYGCMREGLLSFKGLSLERMTITYAHRLWIRSSSHIYHKRMLGNVVQLCPGQLIVRENLYGKQLAIPTYHKNLDKTA